MAGETKVTFRVVGENIEALDHAGNLIERIGRKADDATNGPFTRFNAKLITVNQAMELVGKAADVAARGVGLFMEQVDQADRINKLSQSTGIAVQTLSEYRVAAQLADVDLAQLGRSVGILSRNVIEAQSGVGKTAEILKAMGIDARRAGGDVNVALEGIADAFQRLPDGPTKTALAMEMFGRQGASLIPLLNGGSAALREARNEAIALGVAFDETTSRAAEQFNDNLTRLQLGTQGLTLAVAKELLPGLVSLTDQMVGWAKANESVIASDVATWARGVGGEVEALLPIVKEAYGWFNDLTQAIADWRVGAGEDLLTPASRARVSGWNAPGIAEMDAANDAASRNLYAYRSNDFVGPMQPSAVRGVGASSVEANRLKSLMDDIIGKQNQVRAASQASNEETVKAVQLTKEVALGYDDVASGIERATDKTSAWAQTFSDSVLSVFDALLANNGKVNPIEVLTNSIQRSFYQTFSEELPKIVENGWKQITDQTQSGVQQLAGTLRNSPVGDISGIALSGQSLSYGGGYGMSLADGYGAMSMADGTIGISNGASTSAIAGSQGAAAAGGGGMAAVGGAAGIAGLILLGIPSGAAGIGAAHDVAANGGTARQQKAAFLGALLNTATMGIIPESLGQKVPSELFNPFFGLFEALGIIKNISKSDSRRAGVSEYLREIGLARTPAVNWGGNDNVNRIPIDPAMRSEFGGTLGALGFLSGFEGDRANKEFVDSMLRRQSIIGGNADLMRGDLRYMAEQSGVTLTGAVHTLTQQYIQGFDESGIKSQQQYEEMLRGTIDLLAVDLPNGVNAATIAFASMEHTNRGNIVNLDTFNKKMEEAVNLAGGLQNTLAGGIGSAMGGQISSIINGGNLSVGGLRSALNGSIVSGVSNLAVGQLTNAVTNSDLFKQWNSDIFKAVQSGDSSAFMAAMAQTPDIIDMMKNGVEGLIPIFRELGKVVEEIANSDPQPFYDRADAIGRDKNSYLFSVSTPRQQRNQARDSAQAFQTAYDAALADGTITAKELDNLSLLGQTALQQNMAVQGQYAQGSGRFNRQTGVISGIYDLLQNAATVAGDSADFKNIRGNTLTVDQIITRSNGGSSNSNPANAGIQIVVNGALGTDDVTVDQIIGWINKAAGTGAGKSAMRRAIR